MESSMAGCALGLQAAADCLLLFLRDAQAARAAVGGLVPLELDRLVQHQAQVLGCSLRWAHVVSCKNCQVIMCRWVSV